MVSAHIVIQNIKPLRICNPFHLGFHIFFSNSLPENCMLFGLFWIAFHFSYCSWYILHMFNDIYLLGKNMGYTYKI